MSGLPFLIKVGGYFLHKHIALFWLVALVTLAASWLWKSIAR